VCGPGCDPQQNAAASLKRADTEAAGYAVGSDPQQNAAASLKRGDGKTLCLDQLTVIRSRTLRPH